MAEVREVYPIQYYGVSFKITPGYWAKQQRAKDRGRCFVNLYASAKQLTTNYPKRFPYLEQDIKEIERLGLVPAIDRQGAGNSSGNRG